MVRGCALAATATAPCFWISWIRPWVGRGGRSRIRCVIWVQTKNDLDMDSIFCSLNFQWYDRQFGEIRILTFLHSHTMQFLTQYIQQADMAWWANSPKGDLGQDWWWQGRWQLQDGFPDCKSTASQLNSKYCCLLCIWSPRYLPQCAHSPCTLSRGSGNTTVESVEVQYCNYSLTTHTCQQNVLLWTTHKFHNLNINLKGWLAF